MPDYCLHCCFEDNLCTCDAATKGQPVNNHAFCLPAGTLLDGKYLIGRVLGSGGFGITYLAVDERLGLRVAIKEYMPRAEAVRSSDGRTVEPGTHQDREAFNFGLEKFLEEARVLARISSRDNPRIVSLFSFFTAHGTAYLVMPYLEGQTLAELLRSRGGSLPEQEAKYYLTAILDGLREVHSEGLIHRDIKPHNVFVTNDGGVKLIDFGAARYAQGAKSRALTQVLTAPYAPFEQYSQQAAQGPWTDLYAVGVTFYEMLTGRLPADAPSRVGDPSLVLPHAATSGQVSKELDALVTKAMHPEASERFQTVDEFSKALSLPSSIRLRPQGAPKKRSQPSSYESPEPYVPHTTPTAPASDPTINPPVSAPISTVPAKRHTHPAIYIIGTAIVLLLGVNLVIFGVNRPKPEEPASPQQSEAAEATTTQQDANKVDLEWVTINGGTFNMGSNKSEREQPVHGVRIRTFLMSKSEVTFKQYRQCVAAGHCTPAHISDGLCMIWDGTDWVSGVLPTSFQGDDQPVVCVDWAQARAFASWVGGRLPSEAEWEYAARSGGRDQEYPWGSASAGCDHAVMATVDSTDNVTSRGCGYDRTWQVCSKSRGNTAQGLCDMAGNVWEWVQDLNHDGYIGAPSDGSAWGEPGGNKRIIRGGAWHSKAKHVRAAFRSNTSPGTSRDYLGFRVAKSLN